MRKMSYRELEEGNRILAQERQMLIAKAIHLEALLKDFLKAAEEFEESWRGDGWYVSYGYSSVGIREADVEYIKWLWREVQGD